MIRLQPLAVLLLLLATAAAPAAYGQTTFTVVNSGSSSFTINGSTNPTLDLLRGQTYLFEVNAIGHPFWIKSQQGTGTSNAYNDGVTNNGTQSGTITFVVPADAPATLFYNCQFHSPMTGRINITGTVPVKPVTWGGLKRLF